ncbi:MAG: terminase family protein [Gammaproteobacteria bacterium]|nr:terminase family protein [Gammaproteobacteria bacterium]
MGRISPQLHEPYHFSRYCERLQQAVGGDLRLVFHAPPQHGKSETTLHGLLWIVQRFPERRHAYVTYNQKRANRVAKKFRRYCLAAGIAVKGTLESMELPGGGQVLFTSIDGGITGEPVDGIAIIDDPFKNRKEADSEARREAVLDAYREAIETRVHPGASIFLLATRWHPQDLSGTLIGEGWEYICLPAIAEENDPNGRAVGEALFPEMWSLEWLLKKKAKVLDFTWAALYQGRPRPRGGKVFKGVHYYSKLPTQFRGAFGVDLAFTAKTQKNNPDWSICLRLLCDNNPDEEKRNYFVRWVDRAQVDAPSFTLTLKKRHNEHPRDLMLWRASGTEKGSADFIREKKVPLMHQQPPGDKLVSATKVAEAWNEGRVLVPDEDAFAPKDAPPVPGWEGLADWLYPFLDVIESFTGLGTEKDDDADALGNGFEALQMGVNYDPSYDDDLPSLRI